MRAIAYEIVQHLLGTGSVEELGRVLGRGIAAGMAEVAQERKATAEHQAQLAAYKKPFEREQPELEQRMKEGMECFARIAQQLDPPPRLGPAPGHREGK
jgi:hypothetical protein